VIDKWNTILTADDKTIAGYHKQRSHTNRSPTIRLVRDIEGGKVICATGILANLAAGRGGWVEQVGAGIEASQVGGEVLSACLAGRRIESCQLRSLAHYFLIPLDKPQDGSENIGEGLGRSVSIVILRLFRVLTLR
jgi:hypothetical protein